jgi:hypothetical protein
MRLLSLPLFIWQRERIRSVTARTYDRSPLRKDKGPTEKEKEVDEASEVMRLGLWVSPQERMQIEMTAIDRLIEKAIEYFVFLKTAKKRIRDCSSEDVAVSAVSRPAQARAPRGNDRRSRTEKPSNNLGRDLVSSNQTIVTK